MLHDDAIHYIVSADNAAHILLYQLPNVLELTQIPQVEQLYERTQTATVC